MTRSGGFRHPSESSDRPFPGFDLRKKDRTESHTYFCQLGCVLGNRVSPNIEQGHLSCEYMRTHARRPRFPVEVKMPTLNRHYTDVSFYDFSVVVNAHNITFVIKVDIKGTFISVRKFRCDAKVFVRP